ncbi:hypothetical protein ACTFIV_007886 [Dictyostelium citrinum]
MSQLLLAEKYGVISVDVKSATENPDVTYHIEIYVEPNRLRISMWKEGYNEQYQPVHQGIEAAMAGLVMPSKTGLVPEVEIIGKPVNQEIYVRIPHDPLSALPTYYLKFTSADNTEEAHREGMMLVSSSRTCCFNYTGRENDVVATFKEELIVALGLER